MSRVHVQNFSISLDGFGTGEGLSRDAPFGHAGERLHEWMFETRWWHERSGEPGGTSGIDDILVRRHDTGIGAEIMGAGKYGYPGWNDNPEWKGWWGLNPPFHSPVFVGLAVDVDDGEALRQGLDAANDLHYRSLISGAGGVYDVGWYADKANEGVGRDMLKGPPGEVCTVVDEPEHYREIGGALRFELDHVGVVGRGNDKDERRNSLRMPQCELEGRPSAGGYPEHNDLVDPQRVEERQMGIGLRCG